MVSLLYLDPYFSWIYRRYRRNGRLLSGARPLDPDVLRTRHHTSKRLEYRESLIRRSQSSEADTDRGDRARWPTHEVIRRVLPVGVRISGHHVLS